MNKTILKLTITIISLLLVSGVLFAQETLTAYEVVKKMDELNDGDTVKSDTLMVLMDSSKNKRIRKIKNIRKDYGKDSKGLIFFLSPADVRNTTYMSYDWDNEDKEDDSWLYLPALKKIKRIASSDQSGSFMGSDFTYSDINGMEIENWKYKFRKKSAIVNGVDTWVVEGRPKKEKRSKVIDETGYVKNNLWIRKDNFMLIKGKYWVKKGKKIKYFKADGIKKIDNIWTATKLSMITTKKGKVLHSSFLKISNIIYNTKISDSFFTTGKMERGL
ncbi:MAG: outer membrane lipoprotein-sorting protein [Desulfobacterales bacterium]|nr:outer membrane lipoprotein-sorting protein [Desulfobacterales bacterium]MCP4163171.1 outer membrane lipoprotein-sorting protein [Deltaproteobacteria bacterium]